MNRNILLTGHEGLVGSSILKKLSLDLRGEELILKPSKNTLDLRDRVAVFRYFKKNKPNTVINCAAVVGGIIGNREKPVMYGSDNILIQTNLLDASYLFGVERFIFLGSSCIYPRGIHSPLQENQLFSGELDKSNLTFASAKLAGISLLEAYAKQYNLNKWITLIPTSIYGNNDKFNTKSNHVIPALIEKFYKAVKLERKEVEMIGDGSPLREFLHSDDLAEAVSKLIILENYKDNRYNIGSGTEISILSLAKIIADLVGYDGKIIWGNPLDNGVKRKFLDSSRIEALGFSPKVKLEFGISEVVKHFIVLMKKRNS
jgi:GDP-L-fucose synthase